MRSYVQDGVRVTIPAPADTLPDDLVVVGALVGVALGAAETGQPLVISTEGVYALPIAGATLGAVIYHDGEDLTLDPTDAVKVGVAVTASASGSANVKLG